MKTFRQFLEQSNSLEPEDGDDDGYYVAHEKRGVSRDQYQKELDAKKRRRIFRGFFKTD